MKPVDFFLVGAPKCGTSSMTEYLMRHPGVFIPPIKEPHHFCTDFPEYTRIRTPQEYEALYPAAKDGTVRGDCSVWYLYSEAAVTNIARHNPGARIIVMIRRHADFLHSLHAQLAHGFRENISDLKSAMDAEASRRAGTMPYPATCKEPRHLWYSEVARFAQQIGRYREAFGADKVLVITFEDFVADPKGMTFKAWRFLGLEPVDDGRPFEQRNANKVHLFPRFAYWIRNPPFPFNLIRKGIKSIPFVRRTTPLRKLHRAMKGQQPRETMDTGLRRAITEQFSTDVADLERLLGRELPAWHTAGEDART